MNIFYNFILADNIIHTIGYITLLKLPLKGLFVCQLSKMQNNILNNSIVY